MGKKKGRKKKRFTKLQSQRIHAKRRFRQRFGEPLKRVNLDAAIRDIQAGRAVLIERQSHRVTMWLMVVQEFKVVAVYDSTRKMIATFINPEDVLK